MNDIEIGRINELYKKAKSPEGLTEEEKAEQTQLRAKYISDFKKNLRGVLDNVDIKEQDGSITHAKDIPLKKKADNN